MNDYNKQLNSTAFPWLNKIELHNYLVCVSTPSGQRCDGGTEGTAPNNQNPRPAICKVKKMQEASLWERRI